MKFILLLGSMITGQPGYAHLYPSLSACEIAAKVVMASKKQLRDRTIGCFAVVEGMPIEIQVEKQMPEGEVVE